MCCIFEARANAPGNFWIVVVGVGQDIRREFVCVFSSYEVCHPIYAGS